MRQNTASESVAIGTWKKKISAFLPREDSNQVQPCASSEAELSHQGKRCSSSTSHKNPNSTVVTVKKQETIPLQTYTKAQKYIQHTSANRPFTLFVFSTGCPPACTPLIPKPLAADAEALSVEVLKLADAALAPLATTAFPANDCSPMAIAAVLRETVVAVVVDVTLTEGSAMEAVVGAAAVDEAETALAFGFGVLQLAAPAPRSLRERL